MTAPGRYNEYDFSNVVFLADFNGGGKGFPRLSGDSPDVPAQSERVWNILKTISAHQ
jgi:hypothetical protein